MNTTIKTNKQKKSKSNCKYWCNVIEYSLTLDIFVGHGCAPKKIEASPVLWACKTQSTQHIISMKNMRFSSHPRSKVRQKEPPGSARGLPWWEINIWNGPVWSFSLWISLGNTHALYGIQHPSFKWVQIQSNKAKSEKGVGKICSQI